MEETAAHDIMVVIKYGIYELIARLLMVFIHRRR
jgi:hypothetical protein